MDTPILRVDSAADISCVGKGFQILFDTGEKISLGTAFSTMEAQKFHIVTAATVITDTRLATPIIILVNQAAYIQNDDQFESLLHCDQAHDHNIIVNDLTCCYLDSNGHPGRQSIEADGHKIPLRHEGLKYFLTIREPTTFDWNHCHVIELTSTLPWSIARSIHHASFHYNISDQDILEWSHRLGHLSKETTLYTLQATTQLVKSIDAESRITPRTHFKCRLPCLHPKRLKEGFSTDTFNSNVKSIRGFTCAQAFLGLESGYTVLIPLKSKAYAYTALQDYIHYTGAPLFIMSDAAKEENLGEWIDICWKYCIPQRSSEPYHQHQNKVERRIQDIKRRSLVLMREYNAPQCFWCYAAEYAVEIINHTAARRIKWRTPYKILHGNTPDISVFRFSFFEPIFYLNPHASYPQPNMLPGRFLGIARKTGDHFTFIIVQDIPKTGRILHRSIIQKRNL